MSGNPEPKDHVMAIVTVSTVLLALTPVFIAVQASHQTVEHGTLVTLYAFLSLSFVLGLISTASAVDWFENPSKLKKQCAKWFLVAQTMIFTFSSLILLFLNLPAN